MKRKKLIYIIISICLIFGILGTTLLLTSNNNVERQPIMAGEIPYVPFDVSNWSKVNQISDKVQINEIKIDKISVSEDNIIIDESSILSLDLAVNADGKYRIGIEYMPLEPKVIDCQMNLKLNSSVYTAYIPILWSDESCEYSLDRNENELTPTQVPISSVYYNLLENYQDINRGELILDLSMGQHTIEISEITQKVKISNIYFLESSSKISYSEYLNKYSDFKMSKNYLSTYEAERYALKSDSFIRGKAEKNLSLTPYNTYKKLINTIDAASYNSAGQKILWHVNVPEDSLYEFDFKILQNTDVDKPIYRTIEIDGEVPFAEFEAYKFDNTPTSQYETVKLSVAGQPAKIFLKKGEHTIAMRATMGPLVKSYAKILQLMEEVSDLGLHIQKLSAGNNDTNRTWDVEAYLPEAIPSLKEYSKRIQSIYDELKEIGGKEPTYANSLIYAMDIISKLLKEPRQIPNRAEMISTGDNSVNKYLGVALNNLVSTPLSIDCFYISNNNELPSDKKPFWAGISDFIKSFAYSFSPDVSADSYGIGGAKDNKELNVWINRSVQYVQVLQQMIDAEYNAKNNTNIQLSIMPSEQKLILSNASGQNPDVVLSAAYTTPFNFAIRGAAKDLTEYEDFLSFYNKEYNIESLVPLTYGTGVYGAVESQNFNVLFYREDILKDLGLTVPNTWDDVKKLMPTLLQNSMNFALPLSLATSYKSFGVTSPFIYQNDGTYFSPNGLESDLDNDATLDGFVEMTELYSIYGLQDVVPNFYNSFRFGQIPIGVGSFDTYLKLQIAAPELAGKWKIALAPGTKQENGEVLRYQNADATACMIFKNTKKSDGAWNFLKWWLSSDTQVNYAYKLRSTFGKEYQWNTANLDAFNQLFYSKEDKDIILKQWEYQKEIIMHPTNYMMEREVSNIWNDVVINGKSLIDSIDHSGIVIDREIERKLKEFGYYDSKGNRVKDYNMKVYNTLIQKLAEKGE